MVQPLKFRNGKVISSLVRFKSDPLAAFTFRASERSDPILFEITGWSAKERTRTYQDTVVKTTALTTIIFITNG